MSPMSDSRYSLPSSQLPPNLSWYPKWGMMSRAFFPPSEATQKAINEGKLGDYAIAKQPPIP